MNVALQPDFQGPAENDHGRRGNAALFGMAFDSRIRNPLAPRRDSRVSVP